MTVSAIGVCLEFGYKRRTSNVFQVYASAVILFIKLVFNLISFVRIGQGRSPVSCSPIEGFLCLLIELQYDVYVTFFLRTVPKFVLLTVCISVFICIYTAMGMFIFDPAQSEAQLFFPDYGVGLWNMVMLLSSANWPGPIIPALVSNRFLVTYFYAYLVIVGWGLLNLLLGFNYFFFETEVNIVHNMQEDKHVTNTAAAFRALDVEKKGFLSYAQVDVLLQEMYEFYEGAQEVPSFEERYELILALDAQSKQIIEENDFCFIEQRCFLSALKANQSKKRKFTRYISANIIKKQSAQLVKAQSAKIRHVTVHASASIGRRFGRDESQSSSAPSAATDEVTYNILTGRHEEGSGSMAAGNIELASTRESISDAHHAPSGSMKPLSGLQPFVRGDSTLNRQASLIGRAAEYSGRQQDEKVVNWYRRLGHQQIKESHRERGRALYRFASHAAIQVDSIYFDIGADTVIAIVGVALLCVEYRLDVTILYEILALCELLLKVWVKGIHRYCRSGRNSVDWKIAISLLVLIILDACLESPNHTHVIMKTLVLLRTLLFPRNIFATNGFKNFRQRQRIALAYAFKSINHLFFLLMVLLVMIYVFASIGQEIFGGKVRRDDPAVQESPYGELQYWPLNFNDMPSGMVTMFTLLSVNNMNVIASGFVAALAQWAEVFFALWYAFGVLFLLDVMTALFLSQYIAYLEHKSVVKREAALELEVERQLVEKEQEEQCGFDSTSAKRSARREAGDVPTEPTAAHVALQHEDSLGHFDVSSKQSASKPLEPSIPVASFTSTSVKRLRKVVQFLAVNDEVEVKADVKEPFLSNVSSRSVRFSRRTASKSTQGDHSFQDAGKDLRDRPLPALPVPLRSPAPTAQAPLSSMQRLSRRLSSRFNIRSDSASDTDSEPEDLINLNAAISSEDNLDEPAAPAVSFKQTIFSNEAGRAKLHDWMKEKRKSAKVRRAGLTTLRANYISDSRDTVLTHSGARSYYDALSGRYSTAKSAADAPVIAASPGAAYSPLYHEVKNPIHDEAVCTDSDTEPKDFKAYASLAPSLCQTETEACVISTPTQSWTEWFYQEDQVTPVEEAAVLLQGAIDGDDPELFTSRRGLWCFQKRTQYAVLFRVCSVLYAFLKMFQRPMWTYQQSDWNNKTYFPVSGVSLLAPHATCALNIPLLLVMLLGVLLEVGYQDARFGSVSTNFTYTRALRCTLLLFNCTQLTTAVCCLAGGPPQLAAFASTGGILYMMWFGRRSLRKFASVLHVLPRLFVVLAIYIVMICLIAGIGLFLFNIEDVGKDDDVAEEYFSDFSTATWSLLMAMCTSSYPDQIMPAYRHYREFSLFFVLFMSLGSLIMLKVILVVVFVEYQKASTHTTDLRRAVRQVLVMASFDALDATHRESIDRSQAAAFLNELHVRYPSFKSTTSLEGNMRDAFLPHLDTDDDGCIYVENFWNILEIAQIKLGARPQKTYMEIWHTEVVKTGYFQYLKSVVLFPYTNVLVDCVLAVLMISNMIAHSGRMYKATPADTGLAAAQVFIMLMECCCKVIVRGWSNYWRSFRNQLDFSVLSVALVTVLGATAYPGVSGFTLFLRVALMCRFFWLPRNVRYLFESKGAKKFAKLCRRIADKTLTLSVVLACLVYAFASIGMISFGGQINRDPNGPHFQALIGSRYGEAGYWPLNFNDFTSALILVFSCLNVGDFDIFAEAFVLTSGIEARLYFVAWYVVGTLLMLNIIKSYFLFEFLTVFTSATAKEAEEPVKGVTKNGRASSVKTRTSVRVTPLGTVAGTPATFEETYHEQQKGRSEYTMKSLNLGAVGDGEVKTKIDRTPQWS